MGRKHRSATPALEVLEREAQVVQLRRAKLDWATIAQRVGFNSPQAAQRCFRRAINRVNVASVEELRREDGDMLDRLHSAFWRDAMNGDQGAAMIVLKTLEQKAKLFGEYAPVKQQVEVTDTTRQRLVELVDQIRALPPADTERPAPLQIANTAAAPDRAVADETFVDVLDEPVFSGEDAHALPSGASKYNRSNEYPG